MKRAVLHHGIRLGDVARASVQPGGVGRREGAAALMGSRDGLPRGPRRSRVNASMVEANIKNKLTAFSTGVAPSRMRPYIMTVSGESAPTNINVVLKSAKDMRKEIADEPSNAGRR